ncbi:4'-phosphopantetheinyl transferase [Enterococcus florum]|uniref:4'-phosphopantetheinyl transferase n=1 Tax=Enterococcus florum TaxID=2480627 RepID=A0A4P5PBU4_9ENTE|nr:4'-phosphopantetheinyl transferase [Enterococcus florum]GCF93751.1 4'-phosphopantetheinyl transferase [Enterococcus florum]
MINEAVEILKDQVGLYTTEKDWGSETVAVASNELDRDTQTILKELISDSSKMVSADMYLFMDKQTKKDYVVFFISDINHSHSETELARGLLIDGVLQWHSTGNAHD